MSIGRFSLADAERIIQTTPQFDGGVDWFEVEREYNRHIADPNNSYESARQRVLDRTNGGQVVSSPPASNSTPVSVGLNDDFNDPKNVPATYESHHVDEVKDRFPSFSSVAGGVFGNIANTKSDTENPWNKETQDVLDQILNFKPQDKVSYAEEAYRKMIPKIIGTGWIPAADEKIRALSKGAFDLYVARNNEAVDIANRGAVQGLVGKALEHMKNVKNPTEASAIALALQNLGAKGFGANTFDGKYISPNQALTSSLGGANGLMGYDKLQYGSDINNYNFENSKNGSLVNNYKKLVAGKRNYGEVGCGVVANALLEGNPLQGLISEGCDITLAKAKEKNAYISPDSGYIPQAGDCVLLKSHGGKYSSDHIVVADGLGGYYGNSTGKAEKGLPSVDHGSNLGVFARTHSIVGYIPSGRYFGRGAVVQDKPNGTSDKNANGIMGALNSAKYLKPEHAYKKFADAMEKAGGDPSAQQYVAQEWYKYANANNDDDMMKKLDGIARGGANPTS